MAFINSFYGAVQRNIFTVHYYYDSIFPRARLCRSTAEKWVFYAEQDLCEPVKWAACALQHCGDSHADSPAVRLTTDAVPAVMASTWEWISCLDSSTLFWTQALDAFGWSRRREETRAFITAGDFQLTLTLVFSGLKGLRAAVHLQLWKHSGIKIQPVFQPDVCSP